MNGLRTYAALLCALVFVCCTKKGKEGFDTTFELTTFYQEVEKGGEALYPYAAGYIFEGDTTLYRLPSYEQAVSGTLTTKAGATVQAVGAGIPDRTGLLSFPNITQPVSVIVVYDTENEIYGWRRLEIYEDVERVTNKLRFRYWRTSVYKEAGWVVYPNQSTN